MNLKLFGHLKHYEKKNSKREQLPHSFNKQVWQLIAICSRTSPQNFASKVFAYGFTTLGDALILAASLTLTLENNLNLHYKRMILHTLFLYQKMF